MTAFATSNACEAVMNKRIDEWDELWSVEPVSKAERLAPLIALGVALLIAWL